MDSNLDSTFVGDTGDERIREIALPERKHSLPARHKRRTSSSTAQGRGSQEGRRLSSQQYGSSTKTGSVSRPTLGQYRHSMIQSIAQREVSDPFESIPLSAVSDIVFEDAVSAAQAFTQAASQDHPWANLIMGKAYEHGLLACPRDPALSIHFYNRAAQLGNPQGMMALCAWYSFGAEGVLDQDQEQAFAWAKRAAELGYPAAEYACGYFKEAGVGCEKDAVEAVEWYLLAASKGEKRARQRLEVIQEATEGKTTAEALRELFAGSTPQEQDQTDLALQEE